MDVPGIRMSPSARNWIRIIWRDNRYILIVNSGQADLTVSAISNTDIVSGDTTVFVYTPSSDLPRPLGQGTQ